MFWQKKTNQKRTRFTKEQKKILRILWGRLNSELKKQSKGNLEKLKLSKGFRFDWILILWIKIISNFKLKIEQNKKLEKKNSPVFS